ncbi:MAG: hypothetical protein CMF66_07360 [Magnetovibrio sp.]|nr:hypothetical protein [Magnetovibrio sp.]
MTWSPDLLIIVTLTFLLAGTVKGVIGMALPTVSLGILAATLGLKEAIVLMLVPSFVTNVWQGVIGGNFTILIKRLWGLLAAMLLGTWFGAEALTMTDTSILEALLGVTLIGYGIFGLLTPELPTMKRRERWLSPIVGGATGILAGLTGSTVLPVVPYLQTLGMSRDAFIQAMGICFSTAALGIGIGLTGRSLMPPDLGILSAIGVLPALLGMMVGRVIRVRLSEQRFKQVFFFSVVVLGAYIVARAYIL